MVWGRMNMRSKAFRQSWTKIMLPPNNSNPLAALYSSLLPAKACTSGKDATDKRQHRGNTKPTGSRTGDVQQLSAIINLEATSTMNGAGRTAATPAPCGQPSQSTGAAITAIPLQRPSQATAAISTADVPTPADCVCEGALPGGSLSSHSSSRSASADLDEPLASSPSELHMLAAAQQVADERALVLVGPPQTDALTKRACRAATEEDRARELEQIAVNAMRAYCQAWGAGELGDEFFDWLDWSHSAGIAVFLDVVLEAHRLGDNHLQKFVDYFGKRPAAELLPSVVEALLQSRITRNADFAVMLGEAHLDTLGEKTYTKLMRGYILLGGPGPEPCPSNSLAQSQCLHQSTQLIPYEPISSRLKDEEFCGMLLDSGLLDDIPAQPNSGGLLGDIPAQHSSGISSRSSSMTSWAPEISLSVPTGHWRLIASQDASSMRLGAVGRSPAADLQQPTQHSESAPAPAAAQPSAPSSAPAVSPAGEQQTAMRPVVPRLDLSKVVVPHSSEPSYVPAQTRRGRCIKKFLRKAAAAICCKKPKVVP